MADDRLDEIIPWHFYNAKIIEDGELLSKVKDLNDIERRITARKGWMTRALERVKADKVWSEEFKLTGSGPFARFKKTKAVLEERMAMIVNVYRRVLQIAIMNQQPFKDAFDAINANYIKGCDIMDRLIALADPNLKTDASNSSNNASSNLGLSKSALDTLKPHGISEESLPHTVFDFSERLQIYMNANGIFKLSFPEQRQIARSFMSTQLWNLIRDRITPKMPVFMNKEDPNYYDGGENSVMELLHNEFRRLHPTVTRRLALMKKSQRTEQSSLAFLSEVKRDATSANLRDVNEEALTCMILINGLTSEVLRSELLDLFDVDQDLSLATIESGIRKYEANQKTASYVQGQNPFGSDLFQISHYKKTQSQQRREYAQNHYFCDKCHQKGHTTSRCPSHGSGQQSFKGCSNCQPKDESQRFTNNKSNPSNHLRSLTQEEEESLNAPSNPKAEEAEDDCEEGEDDYEDAEDDEEDQGVYPSYFNMLNGVSQDHNH